MCAAKTSSRPSLQRVAKHLYQRGNSFEFRKVIPPYARSAFGGITTYSRSFGDAGRREAEHLAADCRKYCDRKISEAANRPDPTARLASFKPGGHVPDRAEVDRAVRAWLLGQERDAATRQLTHAQTRTHVEELNYVAEFTPVHQRSNRREALLSTGWAAEQIAEVNQWVLSPDGGLADYLYDRVGRAQRELALRLKAELNFEDRPLPTHAMFDPAEFAGDEKVVAEATTGRVPIMEIFGGYISEQQPAAKTIRKWRTALLSLVTHLGHDDAARVTPDDIIAWKNALLLPGEGDKGRSPGTVRNGYLGAAKPVFGWAKDNRRITTNPVAGVTVRVPRRITNRAEKGYSAAEAKLVLGAALATDCTDDRSHGTFARRWLPWLCAYTGARVTEMAQLRRADVQKSAEGIWYVTIRPDAGSQKSGKARHVVLHPHLVEQGFPQAIADRSGPLFFDPAASRGGKGNSQAQKTGRRVGDWVRSLGVNDEELQPNHGWRHAFIANAYGKIDGDVRRAITGHSSKDEHAEYGNVSLQTMYNQIKRFPRYKA